MSLVSRFVLKAVFKARLMLPRPLAAMADAAAQRGNFPARSHLQPLVDSAAKIAAYSTFVLAGALVVVVLGVVAAVYSAEGVADISLVMVAIDLPAELAGAAPGLKGSKLPQDLRYVPLRVERE